MLHSSNGLIWYSARCWLVFWYARQSVLMEGYCSRVWRQFDGLWMRAHSMLLTAQDNVLFFPNHTQSPNSTREHTGHTVTEHNTLHTLSQNTTHWTHCHRTQHTTFNVLSLKCFSQSRTALQYITYLHLGKGYIVC